MATVRRSGAPKTAAADSGAERLSAHKRYIGQAKTSRTTLRATSKQKADLKWVREQVAMYDEYGPLVGVYADGVSDDVGRLTPRISVRYVGQDWVTLNKRNEALFEAHEFAMQLGHKVLYEWGSESAELRRTMARLLTTQGEAWVFDVSKASSKPPWVMDNDEPFFVLAPLSMTEGTKTRDEITWDSGTGIKQTWKLPAEDLWHVYAPHPSNPLLPYTELQRALPHIREFISAKRRQQSDANSAALNGILRFPEGSAMVDAEGNPVDPMDADDPKKEQYLEAVFDYTEMAKTESKRQYHEPPPPGDFMPNPFVGDDSPEVVDISREIDPQAFILEAKSVENVARALRMPSKLLIEGPGNAKYDNEGLLYQAWLNGVVARYAQLTFNAWSKMWFWPRCLELLAGEMKPPAGIKIPEGFEMRVWFNLDELMPRQDNFENLVDAVRWGAIPPTHLADALGTDPMVAPDGVEDWDRWNIAITGGTGDPGQGIDRRVNDSDGKGKAVGDEQPPSVAAVAALSEPNIPPSDELTRLLSELEKSEYRAWTLIEVNGAAIVVATLDAVKREMARRIPSTPRGKLVRSKPTAAERWATATPQERVQWGIDDLENIIAESVDVSRLETALSAEAAAVSKTFGVEAGLKPEAAASLFAAALVTLLAARIRKGDPSNRQPLWLLNETGLAYAGGIVQGGAVVRNSQGEVLTVTGAPVSGFTQTPAVVGLLTEAAQRERFKLVWRWRHSFYRQPDQSYPQHSDLDGRLANSRYGIDGHVPQQDVNGDYCTCALIPEVKRP